MKALMTTVLFSFIWMLNAQTIRLSEPVLTDQTSETFGAPIEDGLPSVELTSLASEPSAYLGERFKMSAPITKVCQKKGCFFIAQTVERSFRVSFKDYGFFIPTDSGGKDVILTGELIEKELSEEQAAHFQSDLKASSDAIKPGKVYEIVADSIQIPLA